MLNLDNLKVIAPESDAVKAVNHSITQQLSGWARGYYEPASSSYFKGRSIPGRYE